MTDALIQTIGGAINTLLVIVATLFGATANQWEDASAIIEIKGIIPYGEIVITLPAWDSEGDTITITDRPS